MSAPKWLQLWWTDYIAYRARWREPESQRRRVILLLPRLLVNPSLRALLVLRMANASPKIFWHLWRNYFIHLHSMDWSGPLEIGPGLDFPHPVGIMLIKDGKIGTDVGIAHNVTMAGDASGKRPVIGDRVVIYPGAVLMGGVTIGDDSVVGANVTVTRDVPPNSVATQKGIIPLKAAPKLTEDE